MKVRILSICLVVSVLLNIAGLVFFILFLNMRGHYKAVRNEKNVMAHNLSVVRGQQIASDVMQSERIQRRTFVSHVDGVTDDIAVMPPNLALPSTDLTLVVYLHGMGSSYLEPFFFPQGAPIADAVARTRPNVVFLSPSYRREASWGNDTAMSDISQNIRQLCQEFPVKRIVVMGTSMGGCTALTYAATAPEDIKSKIVGVVSVESAGDLAELYSKSGHPALKPAITVALGGTPEQVPDVYRNKSFLPNAGRLPSGVRVAVVSAQEDDIVPPQMQKDIVQRLEKEKVPVKLLEIEGGHGCPPSNIYLEGLDFVLPRDMG